MACRAKQLGSIVSASREALGEGKGIYRIELDSVAKDKNQLDYIAGIQPQIVVRRKQLL